MVMPSMTFEPVKIGDHVREFKGSNGLSYRPVPVTATKAVDEDKGQVQAFVSVTNIEDDVQDIIEAGAYKRTLAIRTPKGCFSHDWEKWVARTEAIREVAPGSGDLPTEVKALGGGALLVNMRFNLKTQVGNDAFENVLFFGDECQWSIGYNVPSQGTTFDTKTGVRRIKDIDLFEYSPVLFGAMPLAQTLSVKARYADLQSKSVNVPVEFAAGGLVVSGNTVNNSGATVTCDLVIPHVDRKSAELLAQAATELTQKERKSMGHSHEHSHGTMVHTHEHSHRSTGPDQDPYDHTGGPASGGAGNDYPAPHAHAHQEGVGELPSGHLGNSGTESADPGMSHAPAAKKDVAPGDGGYQTGAPLHLLSSEDIAQLDGKATCPNCGNNFTFSSSGPSSDGAQLDHAVVQGDGSMTCPSCNHVLALLPSEKATTAGEQKWQGTVPGDPNTPSSDSASGGRAGSGDTMVDDDPVPQDSRNMPGQAGPLGVDPDNPDHVIVGFKVLTSNVAIHLTDHTGDVHDLPVRYSDTGKADASASLDTAKSTEADEAKAMDPYATPPDPGGRHLRVEVKCMTPGVHMHIQDSTGAVHSLPIGYTSGDQLGGQTSGDGDDDTAETKGTDEGLTEAEIMELQILGMAV